VRLTAIRASGLKGQDFAVSLHGADLFVGPNGSGKSSRLLAVLAGLRGLATVPTDPAREYIGTPAGNVELDFGDDDGLVRDLSLTKGKAVAAADALAEALAGPHIVRWDLQDFATATDSARAKLLERVCSVSGSAGAWTATRIEEWLAGAGVWSDVEADAEDPPQLPADKMLVAYPLGENTDAGRWVTAAIEWTAKAFTDANAAAKQAAQTAAGMAEERAAAPRIAGSLDEARSAIARHEADASSARSALAAASAGGTARADHEREGQRLAQDVADHEADQEAQRRERADAEQALAVAVQAETAATERHKAAEAHHAACLETLARAESEEGHAESAYAEALRCVRATRAALETVQRLMEHGGACRNCGHDDPLLLTDRARVLLEAAEDAEVDEQLARAPASLASAGVATTRRTLVEASAAVSEARHAQHRAVEQVSTARARLTRAEDDVIQVGAAVLRATEALTAWSERPAPAAHTTDASLAPLVEAQLAAAEEALVAAKAHHEALVRQQEREAAMQRAIALREETAERLAAVRALGAALKRLQAEIAADAYGPITTEANTLLSEAGSDLRVELHDEADWGARKGRGDDDRLSSDIYVHFAALSDAERATVGVALCYAFARLTKAPWRALILDRMEAIDDNHLPGLLAALVAAVVEERIDNFLGAFAAVEDSGLKELAAETGVSLHWLGRAKPLALVSP